MTTNSEPKFSKPTSLWPLVSYVLGLSAALILSAGAREIPDFDTVVSPFLENHCFECHGESKQKGKVRLDTLDNSIATADAAESWQNILDALNLGEMPPEDEPSPDNESLTLVIDTLTQALHEAQIQLSSSGEITARRLNRREYKNTVEELLGVPIPIGRLPEDDTFNGFDTVGQAQTISALHINRYLDVAREALARTLVLQPLPAEVTRLEGEAVFKKVKSKARKIANPLSPDAKKPATDPARRAKIQKTYEEAMEQLQITETLPGVRDGMLIGSPWSPSKKGGGGMTLPIPGTGWEGTEAARGRYIARVRAALTAPASGESHLLEFRRIDTTSKKGLLSEFIGSVRVDAALDSPRTYEIPFEIDWKGEGVKLEMIAISASSQLQKQLAARAKKAAKPEDIPLIWVDWLEIEGPLDSGVNGRAEIFFKGELKGSDESYIREIIERFCYRAFRHRAPSPEFVDAVHGIYRDQRSAGASTSEALCESLAVVLASPGFLYLLAPSEKSGRLDACDLADRLSYFLWSSAPDDALFAAAESGKLTQPEVLSAQVERMLTDPKSDRFVDAFFSQWLELEWFDMIVVDKQFQFTPSRRASAGKETLAFFRELIREDLSARNLIDSDFLVIDDVMAEFYGLEIPDGVGSRRVKLPAGSPRGGLLGQSAILTMTSTGTRTSPVERGVFVAEKLRGISIPPPPPNVPQLEVEAGLSVQEMLQQHSQTAQCASCHRRIDPLGVALESFDVVGLERLPSADYPFATLGELADGRRFEGAKELKAVLMADADRMARGLLEDVLTYAWGRPVGFADQHEIQLLLEKWKATDYGMRQLIHLVVQTRTFRSH